MLKNMCKKACFIYKMFSVFFLMLLTLLSFEFQRFSCLYRANDYYKMIRALHTTTSDIEPRVTITTITSTLSTQSSKFRDREEGKTVRKNTFHRDLGHSSLKVPFKTVLGCLRVNFCLLLKFF